MPEPYISALALDIIVKDADTVTRRWTGTAPYILITLDEDRFDLDPTSIPMRVEIGGGLELDDATGLVFLLDHALSCDHDHAAHDATPDNAFTTYDSDE